MQVRVEKKPKAFSHFDDYMIPDPYDWDSLAIPEAVFNKNGTAEMDIPLADTTIVGGQEAGVQGDAQGQKIPAPKLGEGENGELDLIEGTGNQDPLDPVIEEAEQQPVAVEAIEPVVEPVVQTGPVVSFDEKQRLVIETSSFKEAWKTAGYYLTPNVGETWIWRRRNKVDPTKFRDGLYGYGFASAAAWYNHTHNKLTDVDLELLKEISGNIAAYDKVKRLKVDVLLSDHLVNLVYSAQRVLYPKEPAKHTGKHDPKVIKQDIQKWKTEQAKLKEKTTLKEPAPKVPGASEGGGSDGGVIDMLLEGFINIQPSTYIIRYLLEQYDKLPQAEKEQRAKAAIQRKIAELNQDKNEGAPDWMQFLSPSLATAWDFITAAQLGYYKQMGSLHPKDIVNLGTRSLRATIEPNFFKGVVAGIGPGIWSWFVDIWESIKAVGSLVGDIAEFAWNLPTHLSNAYEGAKAAGEWIAKNGQLIGQFIKEMFSNSQVLPELAAGIKQSFLSMAESAGKSLAEGAISYISKPYYEQGKSVGNMIGYIIPEIILAVFSGAIGNALKLGLKGLQLTRKAISSLKAFEKAGDLLRMAKTGLMTLKDFFKNFSLFKKSTYAPIKEKFDEIIDMMAEFFGFKIDEIADVSKKVDNVNSSNVPEVSDVTKKKEDMVKQRKEMDVKKKDQFNEEAKKDIENDPDSANDPPDVKESKQKALVLAKGIEAKADAEDIPVAELLARLMPLTSFKGVKDFEAEPLGPGNYMIWMIGSKVPVGKFDNGENDPGLSNRGEKVPDSERQMTKEEWKEQERKKRAFKNAADLDNDGGHSFAYHGAHITEGLHKRRLLKGVKPDGTSLSHWEKIPSSSSQFLSDELHLKAYKEAVADLNRQLISGGSPKFIKVNIPMPGAGKSYKLNALGTDLELPPSTTTHIFAKFVPNGLGGWKLITLFPYL